MQLRFGGEQTAARQILFDMKFLGCRQSKVRSTLALCKASTELALSKLPPVRLENLDLDAEEIKRVEFPVKGLFYVKIFIKIKDSFKMPIVLSARKRKTNKLSPRNMQFLVQLPLMDHELQFCLCHYNMTRNTLPSHKSLE